MSSVSDVVVDGVSTTSVDVYDVSPVGDFAVDGLSSTYTEVYGVSNVSDLVADGVAYAYIDVVEWEEGQPVQVRGISAQWYILAFVALIVLDLLLSRRRRRRYA